MYRAVSSGVDGASTSHEKGVALEEAVEAIESVIADLHIPAGHNVAVTPRKIVVVNGVKHEIDLWIEVEGRGVWLVECKNWKTAVSKNEVIVFAEKVRATEARGGFIAGQKFSRYAVAQSKLYSNIDLKTASAEIDLAERFPDFHHVEQQILGDQSSIELNTAWAPRTQAAPELHYEGRVITTDELGNILLGIAVDDRMRREPTAARIGEEYILAHELNVSLRGKGAFSGGVPLTSARVHATWLVKVMAPMIIWKFDIQDRGLSVRYGGHFGNAEVVTTFVRTNNPAPSQDGAVG